MERLKSRRDKSRHWKLTSMSFETCWGPYLLRHPGFWMEAKRLWQTWQFTRWPALVQAGHLFLLSHHRAALAFGGVFDSALAETAPQFGHLVARISRPFSTSNPTDRVFFQQGATR